MRALCKMRALCINNSGSPTMDGNNIITFDITIDKWYDVVSSKNYCYYQVITNSGSNEYINMDINRIYDFKIFGYFIANLDEEN
jgi:hypothetical protein